MTGWFIAPYARLAGEATPTRYCVMNDYTPQILADGGRWAETEVLGDRAIVKVSASASMLATIAADARIRRLPKDLLQSPLSDLTVPQKTALRNELLSMGYSVAELQDRFPQDLGSYTLADVLRFAASRRLKPRYDRATDTLFVDGAVQPCKNVDEVDRTV